MSYTFTCDYCTEQIEPNDPMATLNIDRPVLSVKRSGWIGHYHDTEECFGHIRDAIHSAEQPLVRSLESIPTISGQGVAARRRKHRKDASE